MKGEEMITKNLAKLGMVVAVMSFAFIGPARADREQLQEKLNQNIEIKLDDVTIAKALETIGQKAELKIVFSDEAVRKLPEGETTRLSVTLQGRLSDSMTEMLNAFFMRYAVGDEQITIYPRPELEHIIGRPSTKQLKVLRNIYSMRITFSHGVPEESVISFIGRSLEVSFLPYDIPNKIYEILKASESDKGTAPTTLCVLLEQIGAQENRPKWYISGTDLPNEVPMIKMVSEEDFRQAKLDQIVDVSCKDEPAFKILQRLTSWTGMELIVIGSDTSWLEDTISVNMQNITLKQALMNMITLLGGKYEIDVARNYLRVQAPEPASPKTNEQKSKEADDSYVGKISIPMEGGKYYIEFMLRQSDLPDELKNFREQMIKEVLSKYSQEAKLKKAQKDAIKDTKTESIDDPQK
jgi:type II secretory pathway component GspD/PulD (secretin)